jgi:tetratricopeptide (TPR) repeat protein
MLKRAVFVSLTLFAGTAYAQEFPPLSQHITDCEGRWILSESSKSEDVRLLGYVYVDRNAGFTIEAHGEVTLAPDGALVRQPDPLEGKARVIIRVERNDPAVCLSDDQTKQLGLPVEWEYRDNYEDHRPPGPHYTAWASHYNQIGGFEHALEFVRLARAENYSSSTLDLEHGFALNALKRYDDAIGTLDEALKRYPRDVEITAELGYANLSLHRSPLAIDLYRRALSYDKKRASSRRAEFAGNIANAYRQLGDAKQERKWREKSLEWQKGQGR